MSTVNGALRLALLGNPNCGKTALFNLLTGSRQKVANYPGVTVDRKEGQLSTPSGKQFRILDLPGAYSLNAVSVDEEITRDVVLGMLGGEPRPDMLVCVSDATNLKLNLRLVLEVMRLGLPMVLAEHDRSGEQTWHRNRRACPGSGVGHAGGQHRCRQPRRRQRVDCPTRSFRAG
jgi:ferrous iron transport protein B